MSWALLLYPTLPTFLVAWSRRLRQGWILLATLAVLVVQYNAERVLGPGIAVREIWFVLGYAALQYGLAASLLWSRQRSDARWLFYAALVLALAPLVAARLAPSLAPADQIGFLGLSYVTFRSVDVLVGIQDRLVTRLSPGAFAGFVLFFPTISAGPVDRYRRFLGDWRTKRSKSEFLSDLDGAVHRLFTGFLSKFILAELIRRYWLGPAESSPGVAGTVSYMYAYSLYLFFDFAGYSAFAIGVGYLFGIHTPENFARPFLARDIRDFWNRWHISLSAWFRDHVYMRFMLAVTRRRLIADRYLASYAGFFLSMGLMGLWHGTATHYLVYGLYHATLLTVHDMFSRWDRRRKLWGDGPGWRLAGIALTSQAVCFGFLIFSGRLG